MATLQGIPELESKLKAMGLAIQQQALVKAGREGAELIRADAARSAPRRTGKLAEGMTTKVVRPTPSDIEIDIGPGKKQFYGYFVEFGTGTAFNASGAREAGYPGRSKGARTISRTPQPHLIPAFKANIERAQAVIASAFKRIVDSFTG